MKKIIGIMAFILIGTMLTGCGNVDEFAENIESSIPQEDTVIETEETSEQIVDTAETVQEDNSTETEIDTADQEMPDSYEEALRAYFDAQSNKDYDQLARLIYPDKIIDGIYTINELGAEAFASEMDALSADLDVTYEITEIIEEDSIPDEALEELVSTFDRMLKVIETVESYGGNTHNLTEEQNEELYNIMYDSEEISGEHVYTATEGYDVTVRYLKNGEPDEDYFYVYYIDGEGWKLNNTMRKYIEKVRQSMANVNAKTLFNVYATTFVELDVDGIDVSGSYLISSDDSKNMNIPSSVDVSKVKEPVGNYFSEAEEFDYFVIIQNGACVYTAMEKKDGTGKIGTYPSLSIPVSLSEHGLEMEEVTKIEYTLDELYGIAKGVIG